MTAYSLTEPIAGRYFKRLEEALLKRYPRIHAPVAPDHCSLEDFYLAIRKLLLTHELPGLGFEFGCALSVSDYGVVGLAIASTRSLSEAIATQLKFLGMITNTAKVSYQFYQDDKWMVLKVHEVDASRPLDHFTIESELGAQLRFVKDLLPDARMAQCILSLPHECPTSPAIYKKLGGCQVKFRQPDARLQIPCAWADKPLDSADELLAPLLAQRCELIASAMDKRGDWVERVRNLLLTSDSCSKSLIETADALGVSTHNLRWHLARENANYKQILLDVRMNLACQYLEGTPLTLQQISYQLGYTYPGNFQLAFKKYFEVPPGAWRSRSN